MGMRSSLLLSEVGYRTPLLKLIAPKIHASSSSIAARLFPSLLHVTAPSHCSVRIHLVIIIENLERVVQNGFYDSRLPSCVSDITGTSDTTSLTQQCWTEAYRKIAGRHAIPAAVFCDSSQVQRQDPERSIVGIRQSVNDCVQGIATRNIFIDLCRVDELAVSS